MAKSPRTDDLFDNSKMSFGSHLEELRTCLVRSLLGLGIGFVIALIFANQLVALVKLPLEQGLKNFYVQRDSAKMQRAYQLSDEEHEALKDFMIERQVTVEFTLFEKAELAAMQVTTQAMAEELAERDQEPAENEEENEEKSEEGAKENKEKAEPAPEIRTLPWWQDGPPELYRLRTWKPLVAKIVTLSGPEAFLIFIKAAIIGGFVLASPWIFFQLWNFVAAGLYPHERKYVYVYIPFSVILFLSGAAMAFFVVFDFVLDFLFTFNSALGLEAEPRISEWLGFVMILPVGFGIAFQLPLVMLLLYRIGIFSVEAYISKWRIAILVIFVISMILTPADPISMLAMACPLTALYFLGIILCKFMPRTRNPFGETGYDPGANPED